MKAFWFVLSVVGLSMAAGALLASLPRRRRSSTRWVKDGETGLREYILTPWMRGERR